MQNSVATLAAMMQQLIDQNGSLSGGYLSVNSNINNSGSYLLTDDGAHNVTSCNNTKDCSKSTNDNTCHNTGICTGVMSIGNTTRVGTASAISAIASSAGIRNVP